MSETVNLDNTRRSELLESSLVSHVDPPVVDVVVAQLLSLSPPSRWPSTWKKHCQFSPVGNFSLRLQRCFDPWQPFHGFSTYDRRKKKTTSRRMMTSFKWMGNNNKKNSHRARNDGKSWKTKSVDTWRYYEEERASERRVESEPMSQLIMRAFHMLCCSLSSAFLASSSWKQQQKKRKKWS